MDSSPHPAAADGTHEQETAQGVRDAAAEAAELWPRVLGLLRPQISADSFASLLGGTRVVEATEDTWTIGVRPHAARWLSARPYPLIERTVAWVAGRRVSLQYVAEEPPAADRGPALPPAQESQPAPPRAPVSSSPPVQELAASGPTGHKRAAPSPPGQKPAASSLAGRKRAPSSLVQLLSFDPNSAMGGGFWKMGHYANWFWAAYLGTVAWRVYELVVSGDKRAQKTLWTPPRRYSVSELARAIASGRQRQPNRAQIRGRYRRVNGQRVWSPGAFDLLAREGVARIEWHDGDVHWRPWQPGGSTGPGRSGIRVVYRISVVTSLPLLTPHQVARLPAQNQVEHERYLANRGQDLVAWEQIALPTLAGLDPEAVAGNGKLGLVHGHQ